MTAGWWIFVLATVSVVLVVEVLLLSSENAFLKRQLDRRTNERNDARAAVKAARRRAIMRLVDEQGQQ